MAPRKEKRKLGVDDSKLEKNAVSSELTRNSNENSEKIPERNYVAPTEILISEPWSFTVREILNWLPSVPPLEIDGAFDFHEIDNNSKVIAPIVVVCGPKNTGKSTFCRYLVNSLLGQYPEVAFLETDVGQPEFTIPGCISLHFLKEATPEPSHLRLKTPHRFHYFGDINPKSDPELYLLYISELYDYFRGNIHCSRNRNPPSTMGVPLVVNTHGWIKGTGYDVLVEMLRYTCPTHVVKFSGSTVNKSLPSGLFWDECNTSTEIYHVDPASLRENARPIPQRSASDLRSLRFLASFAPFSGYNQIEFESLDEKMAYASVASSLTSARPFKVPISGLKVINIHGEISPSMILRVLNGSLVTLAREKTHPMSHPRARLLCDCVGVGIVRSVDPESKLLYILTLLPFNELKTVDVLLHGKIALPPKLLQAGDVRSPYLSEELPFREGLGAGKLKSRNNIHRKSLDS